MSAPVFPALPPGLLHPELLALGAGLTAIPIVIHLLNRRRVRRQPWAAMRWLLAAARRHQRRLRLENWLILLLRVAAILLLGLALARPVLTDPGLAGLFAGKRSVYLVLDNSLSMAASREGRTVLDVAKAEADAVLSRLGTDDTVAVVVTNDPRVQQSDGTIPFVAAPRSAGRDAATRAKEAVAGLTLRHAPARWAETLSLLRRQTVEEDVNRLVVLVTDLQETDWKDEGALAALEDILRLPAQVRVVAVGGRERRNLTVARITTPMRRDAFAGRSLRLAATVENQGPEEVQGAHLSVYLGSSATPLRRVQVPPLPAYDRQAGQRSGSETVLVELSGRELAEAGSQVLMVEVEPPEADPAADSLGPDSRRAFALRLRDRIHVVAWTRASQGADPGAETYLRGIFERFETDEEGNRVERQTLYDLRTPPSEGALLDILRGRGQPADLVVLANVAPREETAAALRAFVQSGGALLAFVGDNPRLEDPASLNDLFYADPDRRLLPFPFRRPEVRSPGEEEPFRLDLEVDTGHPLAAPFTGPDAQTWIGLLPPALWGRMPFVEPPASVAPDGGGPVGVDGTPQVVLRFAGDEPAPFVVEGDYGAGKALWVATSVDHGWFERALPFFLPVFLDEAAVYLTRPDDARRNLEIGRRIVVTWVPRGATDVRFAPPGGAETTPTRYDAAGALERPTWVQDRIGVAGVWRLLYESDGHKVEEHFAVNPDPAEGRLGRAPDELLLRRAGPDADLQVLESWDVADSGEGDAREGEIAALVLWIVMGLLLLESLLAYAFGRRRGSDERAPAARPGGST